MEGKMRKMKGSRGREEEEEEEEEGSWKHSLVMKWSRE